MGTMREMAEEYRRSAALLATRIAWLQAQGIADPARLQTLRAMLEETRAVQQALSGYYELPRPEGITAALWRARGESPYDH